VGPDPARARREGLAGTAGAAARGEPVRVTRHNRVVGVMVNAEDYEAMRQFYADRLLKTMDRTAETAERAGLTLEKLAELLADES